MKRRYATGHGDETTVLISFLDQYRDTMVFKISGLDEEQARWAPAPTANSLLVLIVHLTGVERSWSEGVILGHEVDRNREEEFNELVAATTVERAVAEYLAQCERTNEILRSVADLNQPCAAEAGYSVRWVVLHLLEETARHAGHADITRELIDGSVGQ